MNQARTQQTKVALVTGAGRRIGAAIVTLLHHVGYKVLIHCRQSLKEAQALALQLNAQCADSALVVQKDLTEEDAASYLVETVSSWAGRLDLLVNNASVFIKTEPGFFNALDWQSLFDIHVKTPFILSHKVYPLLKKQQGNIINITDIHANKPLKGYSVYSQSKAALTMQTRTLAREFAPEVRVNAVAPGAILWPEDANSLSLIQQQKIIEQTPLKRPGNPQVIAQAVLSLAENPFITGQILKVDGGRSL